MSKKIPKESSSQDKGFFQENGEIYSKFRPKYPKELVQFLSSLVGSHSLALDIGCGSGQLTHLLAPYFDSVIGTDLSKSQVDNVKVIDNVKYLIESAEKISMADNSVDLITVAQAAHWFDLDIFYSEVRRVSKKNTVIALISYGVPYIKDPINSIFQKGYWQDVHEFWSEERTHVETGYLNLPFPFERIELPSFNCIKHMSINEFIGYITTWSSYTNAVSDNAKVKFDDFFNSLREVWPNNWVKEVVWPISVIAGNVNPLKK